MHSLLLATVFIFQLINPASIPPTAEAGHAGLRCPIELWRGFCNYMTAGQKDQLREALQLHGGVAARPCIQARDALLEWLGDGKQAWVFELHAHDDASAGTYVLGQTVGIRPAAGFGLRLAAFIAADARTLAWIALHEGAHLAGEKEEGASWVHSHCTLPAILKRALGSFSPGAVSRFSTTWEYARYRSGADGVRVQERPARTRTGLPTMIRSANPSENVTLGVRTYFRRESGNCSSCNREKRSHKIYDP